MEQYDFFISHASEDAGYARSLVDVLEEKGVRCWIAPRDIPGGSDYGSEIVKAIQASRSVVLIMSAKANNAAIARQHIIRELEEASNLRKTIYPIRLEHVHLHESLRYRLNIAQWIEHINDREKLADVIISLLKNRSIHMPPPKDKFKYFTINKNVIYMSFLGILFFGIAALYTFPNSKEYSVPAPNYDNNFRSERDRIDSKSQLIANGYDINNIGLDHAVRKGDMQSLLLFKTLDMQLSKEQLQNLMKDEILREQHAITPIWIYISQATDINYLGQIRKELRDIISRNDMIENIYNFSCNKFQTDNFWSPILIDVFGAQCNDDGAFYDNVRQQRSRLFEMANTNASANINNYAPKIVKTKTIESIWQMPTTEQNSQFIRMTVFFSMIGNNAILFTENYIHIYTGYVYNFQDLQALNCRSELKNFTVLCRGDAVMHVEAKGQMRFRSNSKLSDSERVQRVNELFQGATLIRIEGAVETSQAAFRNDGGNIWPCKLPPGVTGRDVPYRPTCPFEGDRSISLE